MSDVKPGDVVPCSVVLYGLWVGPLTAAGINAAPLIAAVQGACRMEGMLPIELAGWRLEDDGQVTGLALRWSGYNGGGDR